MEKFRKRKIIIDTDPGIDDAMAIMLAVKSKAFDIKAITTVCGNTTIEKTTTNARYVLDALGTKIPVFSGAEKPLRKKLVTGFVMGESGLGGITPPNDPGLNGKAAEKIIEIIAANPNEVTIVAIGPLTNIATAMAINPEVMKQTKELIIMGGAIDIPGNKTLASEFNIFVDPEAAKEVFEFPVKKTLVPLDICYKTLFALKDFEKITDPSLREILLEMVRPYIENLRADENIDGAAMYDVLTIYYLLDQQNCGTYQTDIKVETDDRTNLGRTYKNDLLPTNEEDNITVLDRVDKERFVNYFLQTINGDSETIPDLENKMVTYRNLREVPVKENGERFVFLDPRVVPNGYVPGMNDMETALGTNVPLRESVAKRLQQAQEILQEINPDYSLFVTYGYRSLEVQTQKFLGQLGKATQEFFPDPANLYEEVHRFVAVPTVAGHPTGGAVDIIIIDKKTGQMINFGGPQYDYTTKNCYVFNPNVDENGKENRMLLRRVMMDTGFAPFDGEWWHFSYGDREWAYYYGQPNALYDQQPISTLQILEG